MTFLEALLLGIFQGITEFLPVSSSGHLVLAEYFLGLDPTLLLPFDALLHLGTLLSLIVLFWSEIVGFGRTALGQGNTDDRRLLGQVLLAAIPVSVVGFLFQSQIELLRMWLWVGILFVLTGVFFLAVEWYAQATKNFYRFSAADPTKAPSGKLTWTAAVHIPLRLTPANKLNI